MLTQDRVRSLFRYDPETGVLTWLVAPCNSVKAGAVAGWRNKKLGYWYVSIDGAKYTAHQVIWLYMTGRWSEVEIDHRDRDSTNNRWANLREATHSQNLMNQKMNAKNTSGVKGVTFDKTRKKWVAEIKAAGRKHHLGRFATKEQAALARQNAAVALHGEYANTER